MSFVDEYNLNRQQSSAESRGLIIALTELEKDGEVVEVKTPEVLFVNGEYMIFVPNRTYHNILTNERGTIKDKDHLKELIVHED